MTGVVEKWYDVIWWTFRTPTFFPN